MAESVCHLAYHAVLGNPLKYMRAHGYGPSPPAQIYLPAAPPHSCACGCDRLLAAALMHICLDYSENVTLIIGIYGACAAFDMIDDNAEIWSLLYGAPL